VLATRGGGDGGVGAGGGKLTMMDKAQFLSLRDATAQPPETLKTVMHAALGETNTSGFPANPHFLRSSRDLISRASNLLKRTFFFRTKIKIPNQKLMPVAYDFSPALPTEIHAG